ncbi:Mur ligase family protein [Aquimarina algiphila]|uniref:Mur ligase family protein n=1 Tax=Aquimarina algiphila TaxID=2047982 RepID=UPI0024936258|nr:Mur ligase family protein [Aquimarina algiphila]
MIIGVTGTNGKTSTLYFLEQLYKNVHKNIYTYGSRGFWKNQERIDRLGQNDPLALLLEEARFNTPDCDFYFEAHSPFLKNDLYDGIQLDMAVLTKISNYEHTEYHENYEEYRQTKLKLFSKHLKENGVAITNHKYLASVKEHTNCVVLTFGSESEAHCWYEIEKNNKDGVYFSLYYKDQRFSEICIPSAVFIPNFCAAILCADSSGISIKSAIEISKRFSLPRGRHHRIKKYDKDIIIDFAHNPGGLLCLLKDIQLKSYASVWTVFGCGGDRSKTKRPLMGKIAKRYSDVVIITEDQSRSESTTSILDQIAQEDSSLIKIREREKAIKYAVYNAPKGAVILVLGMGDDTYVFEGVEIGDYQLVKNISI